MSTLWRKAQEAAREARILFEAELYDGASNRAYYAMFTAARALLAMRAAPGARAKRHATVWRAFSLHFVKDGPFDVVDSYALTRAGEMRNVADYSDRFVTRAAIEGIIASMDRFMVTAEDAVNREQEAGRE